MDTNVVCTTPFQEAMPPTAPRFGYLLRLGLESVGVRYVPVELLRKAKKNQTTELEYWALWRLLHDLVLVVLADFEVDRQEVERLNAEENVERELLDPELHNIQMELVRFYLYDWGFVCTAFYAETAQSPSGRPSSQVLLLAVAWLLAFSKFFERQHRYILERCTESTQLRLPPFPNDVDLDADCVSSAAAEALQYSTMPRHDTLALGGQMHQLHSAFGRLQGHLDELDAYTRYHERLIERLEPMQNKPEEYRDELIPAYVVSLLADPARRLADQVRLLSQSIQMIEDEALFYKWINGLVRSVTSGSDSQVSPIAVAESKPHAALHAQIREVQTLFQAQAASFQQIEQTYQDEWKKWRSRQKSRSRVQQMEAKVERFTLDVQTQELFDPQQIFLSSQRSWEGQAAAHASRRSKQTHMATLDEVERLQTQIASVISEITREYCGLQLR